MSIFEKLLEITEKIAIKKHKAPSNYDESKLKSIDKITHQISCGSILLCSGTAAESRLIEEVDKTDFSHAAIIVKFHNNTELYVWTADTVKELDDKITKGDDIKHSGSHLLILKDYVEKLDHIYPSPDGSKYRFAYANLTGIIPDLKKLWKIMYKYDNTPFPSTSDEFKHFIEGQLNIDSGMENSFCAQMVAKTYQEMGWLNQKHPANYYNPGSFAKTEKINHKLINGAKLEAPIYFKL